MSILTFELAVLSLNAIEHEYKEMQLERDELQAMLDASNNHGQVLSQGAGNTLNEVLQNCKCSLDGEMRNKTKQNPRIQRDRPVAV